jgi:transposase-like protein
MDGSGSDEGEQQVGDGVRQSRRHRSVAERVRIVGETLKAGVLVREIAHRHGVNPSVVYRWRVLHKRGLLMGRARKTQVTLLPVEIGESSSAGGELRVVSRPGERAGVGAIEVEFSGGRRLSVRGVVDAQMLRQVIQGLSQS